MINELFSLVKAVKRLFDVETQTNTLIKLSNVKYY